MVVADATYIMGDGESPTFAETMVLQKAKQKALEEAGTYVESYTKVQNLDLTTEEIQTIAGSVLQVEVLENKRSLVGDGLQFYVKIKAIITSDKMEDLAQRIRGKNVAGEYTRLQGEYARLNREIESWKILLQKAPGGKERDAALEEIRVRERDFEGLRKEEQGFFEQVVSGQALVLSVKMERGAVDDLLEYIAEKAYVVKLQPAKAQAQYDKSGLVKLTVQGSIRLPPSAVHTIEATATRLGGAVVKVEWDTGYLPLPAGGGKQRQRLVFSKRGELQTGSLITISPYTFSRDYNFNSNGSTEAQEYLLSRLAKLVPVMEFVDRNGILGRCNLRSSDLSLLYPVTEYWDNQIDSNGKLLPKYKEDGFLSLIENPPVISGYAPLFHRYNPSGLSIEGQGKNQYAFARKDDPKLQLSPNERKTEGWGSNSGIFVASTKFVAAQVLEENRWRAVPLLALVDSEGYFLVEALIPEEGLQTLEKVTVRFAWAEAVKGGLKDLSCSVFEDTKGLLSAPKPTIAK
ncbi:MAG: hypothetical protein ABIP05_04600 [Nitrospiraceae bacterium]